MAVDGRFELLDELGRGGAGTVWRARERDSGREVALKLIRAGSPASRARVQREGELAARLDHAGIVRIHALGECQGLIWLACELVEGARTLDAVLPTLGLAERLALIRDAARALGHAHARGVTHRDVKPQNLLVGADGRVRVSDFGVATALGMDRLTRTGALVGTPAYMAPELVAPETGVVVGPPTDVWALGVLLYQALTDRLPFEAESFLGLAASICEAAPPPPRALRAGIPPAAEAVCLRALSRAPADRYPDGEALAADLERVLRGERPASTTSGSRAARPRAPLSRQHLAGAGLVLGFLLLGGLVGVALLPEEPGAVPVSHTQLQAVLAGEGQPRARLEAALEAALRDAVPAAGVEAEARLQIARHAAHAQPPDWEAARVHAVRAAALDPQRVEVHELLAVACEALGQAGEAVAPRERLSALRGAPADWAALARVRLAAGQGAGAHEACQRARAQGAAGPELVVRCALAAGQVAVAEAEVAALGSNGSGLALAALVARAAGRDPEPLLRAACAAAPGEPGPALALAEELLRRGEVEEAAAALAPAGRTPDRPRVDPRVEAWLALTTALLEVPELAALEGLDPALRAPIGAWLLREGLRDVPALSREEQEAGGLRHLARRRLELAAALLAGADPPGEARACVGLALLLQPEHPERRALLERALVRFPGEPQARALLAREHLDRRRPEAAQAELERASAPWLDRHEHQLLRAEAHLARSQLKKAENSLNRAERWAPGPAEGPEACRLRALLRRAQGREPEARKLLERVTLLQGARLPEARVYWDEGRTTDDLRKVERALGLAPGWPEAHVMRCYAQGKGALAAEGMRQLLGAVRADPAQQALVTRLVRDPLLAGPFPPVDELLAAGVADEPHDPLLRAWLLQLVIEHRSAPGDDPRVGEALALLDDWLVLRPHEALAWLLHGALALRRGWVHRAARDLEVAEQLAGCGGMVAFYRSLLEARRTGQAEGCAELLRAAYRRGYPRTDGDRLCDGYPELRALAHDALARALIETAR